LGRPSEAVAAGLVVRLCLCLCLCLSLALSRSLSLYTCLH
jgi:hypothetical protein